jgi:hypothetical protein
MTRVSFPHSVTSQIANTAAQYAREDALGRGWKSSAAFRPISGTGYVGIGTSKKYHMYQELGTKPYLMRSLEGKIIPIKGPDGTHFVRCTGVGQPGWVTKPGGIKIWKEQKWLHPGLKPTSIMGNATKQAIKDNRALVVTMLQELVGQIQGGLLNGANTSR